VDISEREIIKERLHAMSKRALIVIGALALLPIIITLCVYISYCADNPVVASYDGDVTRISYDGKTLIAVGMEEDYRFRYGEYLGKIGDRNFGPSLYRVLDDENGCYYAVADRDRNILYTESGELEDGMKTEGSTVTRLVFDSYSVIIEGSKAQSVSAAFMGDGAEKIEMKPSTYRDDDGNKQYRVYDIWFSYDGSAVLTENAGKLFYLTEEKMWVFVPLEIYEEGVEEYGESSSKLVLESYIVRSAAARLILSEYIPK
jgi:hypothetical protein